MINKEVFLTSVVALGVSLAVNSAEITQSQPLSYSNDALAPHELAISLDQIRARGTHQVAKPSAKSSSGATTQADPVVIDLMVWFQPAYVARLGEQSTQSRVVEMVAGLNTAFQTSGVDASVRLVNAESLQNVSDELGLQDAVERFNTVLIDPQSNPGGYYENSQYLAYGADLALYLRDFRGEQSSTSLGSGTIEGEVSVVLDRHGYEDNFTEFETEAHAIFMHVIGHNLGGDHERGRQSILSESDARATTCDGGKNTIMWSGYFKDSFIGIFSNPTIERGGEFCGELGVADNTRVLNSNVALAAARRDAPPSYGDISFSQSDYPVNEVDGTVSITLTRTGSLTGESTVELAVIDNSAQVGADIATASATQRVTFASGEDTATATIELIADAVAEEQESAFLQLRYPLAATASSTQATLTIDDPVVGVPGEITVSVSEAKVEGEDVVVTLDRVNGTDGEISLTVATSLMTATDSLAAASADDFAVQSTNVVFADGETQKTVTVATTDDALVEATEGFTITVTNGQDIVISNGQLTAEILDNDEEATTPPPATPTPPPTTKKSGGGGSFGWLSVLLAGMLFRKTK